MREDAHQKVNADHLKRNAYLYVRQSTLRQVFENTESTLRQYDLRRQALALGWAAEQIVVIDNDLGQSGASAVGREGFQRLVTEVSMGHAGIVLGLEVSRLARNPNYVSGEVVRWQDVAERLCGWAASRQQRKMLITPTHRNSVLVMEEKIGSKYGNQTTV
jgi:DNA invertase Pin-like site-specific DNA recombinase